MSSKIPRNASFADRYAFALGLVFLVTPPDARIPHRPPPPPQPQTSVDPLCLFESQFKIFTVTTCSTLPVVSLFVRCQTPSINSDLPVHRSQPKASQVAREPKLQMQVYDWQVVKKLSEALPFYPITIPCLDFKPVSANDAHGVLTKR